MEKLTYAELSEMRSELESSGKVPDSWLIVHAAIGREIERRRDLRANGRFDSYTVYQ